MPAMCALRRAKIQQFFALVSFYLSHTSMSTFLYMIFSSVLFFYLRPRYMVFICARNHVCLCLVSVFVPRICLLSIVVVVVDVGGSGVIFVAALQRYHQPRHWIRMVQNGWGSRCFHYYYYLCMEYGFVYLQREFLFSFRWQSCDGIPIRWNFTCTPIRVCRFVYTPRSTYRRADVRCMQRQTQTEQNVCEQKIGPSRECNNTKPTP